LDYDFFDINFHRFEQSITKMSDQGIVAGYNDGSFRPEKKIMSTEIKQYIGNSFSQSKRQQIDSSAVNILPQGEVSLSQALMALFGSYKLNVWADKNNDASTLKPYLDKALSMNILPVGLYDLDKNLTRAEFAAVIDNLLETFKQL